MLVVLSPRQVESLWVQTKKKGHWTHFFLFSLHHDVENWWSFSLRYHVKKKNRLQMFAINNCRCDWLTITASLPWAATYSSQAQRSFQWWHRPVHPLPSSAESHHCVKVKETGRKKTLQDMIALIGLKVLGHPCHHSTWRLSRGNWTGFSILKTIRLST